MNTRNPKFIAAALALLALSMTPAANAGNVDFNVDVEAGTTWDSNAGIVELDDTSGEDDTQSNLKAGLGVIAKLHPRIGIRVGYDYTSTTYRRLSQFDLGLQHGVAELTGSIAGFDMAVAYDRFDGELAGADYVEMTQVSPSIGRLIGDSVYLRLAYIDADKTYAAFDERSAIATSVRGDAYFLLNGMRHYVALSVQSTEEDAVSDLHDYDGIAAGITWGRTLDVLRGLELKAKLKYEQRDYLAFDESLDAARDDTRLRGSLSAMIPFTDAIGVEGFVEATRNTSNLASAELDREIAGVKLVIGF